MRNHTRISAIVLLAISLCVLTTGCGPKQTVEQSAEPELELRPVEDLQPVVEAVPTEQPADQPAAEATAPAAPAAEEITAPQPTEFDAPQPVMYTIRKGDTLWSISKKYLGDGKRWTEIIDANPGLDEKKLKIGQSIVIPQK